MNTKTFNQPDKKWKRFQWNKWIVLICFFCSAFGGNSQITTMFIGNPPPVDTIPDPGAEPVDCSISNAEWFCGSRSAYDKSFNNSNTACCLGNKTKFYYRIMCARDFVLGSLGQNIEFGLYTNSSFTTPIYGSYKFYGPFNQTDPYISLVEDGLAVPLSLGASSASSHFVSGSLIENKVYILEITAEACWGFINFNAIDQGEDPFLICSDFEIECENCIPKFQPVDDRYVVSAWVKELAGSTAGALNYTNSLLKVSSGAFVDTLYPSGQIVDGWQRIEGVIQTNSVGNLKMELIVSSGTSYFDDIRVFPYDGSMITYVYDPITLRLMAELDERNYAKIYEYDEEGKLVRVKKETEKGIMTIQENRENSSTND